MTIAGIELEGGGPVLTATIRGDIDLSNADSLREELSAAIPNEALGLVLDLSEVEYLDSAGLRLVHHLREDLRARGQHLRIALPEQCVVRDALRLAGLDWRDTLSPTPAAARSTFERQESASAPATGGGVADGAPGGRASGGG